ncbi:MAG: hypothetical protein KF754_11730 [Planctomycetes bacterium]|nr:hypothetical protein [Planctomycetota bacterium]
MNAETVYLFRHAILRDAAYALQPPSERTGLHANALEILAQEPDAGTALAADIADHAREARDNALELQYLVLAADHAARVYDLDSEARLCLRAAANAACSPRQVAELELRAAGALFSRGRLAESGPVLERAVAAAQGCRNEGLELAARLRQCDLWQRTNRKTEALEAIPALVERARALDDKRLLVSAELALDDLHTHRGESAQSAQALQRALELARALHDAAMQAKVTSALAYRLHRNGQTAEGEALARNALALKTDDVIARATLLNSIGVICVETSRLDEAEAAYREGVALAAQSGRRMTEAGMLANLGNLDYYFRGNLDSAARQYAKARDVHLEAGDIESAARNARMAGLTDFASGRRAAAASHFQTAIQLARTAGNTYDHLDSRRFLALCLQETRPGHDALPELLDVALQSVTSGYVRTAILSMCDVARRLLAAGRPVAAARAHSFAVKLAIDGQDFAGVGPLRLLAQVLGLQDLPEAIRTALARGMPARDTPHHYINLTLWPDLSRLLLHLHGVDGAAHLGRADTSAGQECQAILDRMRELALRARAYHTVTVTLGEAQIAMAESAAAMAESRPAMLFRGALVASMTPQCLAALGQQMRAQSPQEFLALQRANPGLATRLDGPAPGWADADLPDQPLDAMEAALQSAQPRRDN